MYIYGFLVEKALPWLKNIKKIEMRRNISKWFTQASVWKNMLEMIAK